MKLKDIGKLKQLLRSEAYQKITFTPTGEWLQDTLAEKYTMILHKASFTDTTSRMRDNFVKAYKQWDKDNPEVHFWDIFNMQNN